MVKVDMTKEANVTVEIEIVILKEIEIMTGMIVAIAVVQIDGTVARETEPEENDIGLEVNLQDVDQGKLSKIVQIFQFVLKSHSILLSFYCLFLS